MKTTALSKTNDAMSTQQNSKFTGEQYAMILNFLEEPQNKARIWGVSGKTEVGVAPPRKIEAWKELSAIINNRFKGKYTLNHKSMADRFRTYMNKYRDAREKSSATGFGVTDDDKKRNIHTVQAKLESMCPHYERMHALVGERPNVSPASTFDSGSITSGVDLNEVLRLNIEDCPMLYDEEVPVETEDSSGPYEFAPSANEDVFTYSALLFSNEEETVRPQSPPNLARTCPELADENNLPIDIETYPMLVVGSKHQATVNVSDGKKSKKDRRKDLPSLCLSKNPTQARNLLAQTIQESASAKAAALVTIEEKRLKFEQMKWDVEREERDVRRREDEEEKERRCKEDEQRRQEYKEKERKRRDEDKAEKLEERRFALMQTLFSDGKSAIEIKEILDMLL
ncbi:hypothetical protein OROGR_031003 [Orobanche gracilis]